MYIATLTHIAITPRLVAIAMDHTAAVRTALARIATLAEVLTVVLMELAV